MAGSNCSIEYSAEKFGSPYKGNVTRSVTFKFLSDDTNGNVTSAATEPLSGKLRSMSFHPHKGSGKPSEGFDCYLFDNNSLSTQLNSYDILASQGENCHMGRNSAITLDPPPVVCGRTRFYASGLGNSKKAWVKFYLE